MDFLLCFAVFVDFARLIHRRAFHSKGSKLMKTRGRKKRKKKRKQRAENGSIYISQRNGYHIEKRHEQGMVVIISVNEERRKNGERTRSEKL